jgi:hypothetical protein
MNIAHITGILTADIEVVNPQGKFPLQIYTSLQPGRANFISAG